MATWECFANVLGKYYTIFIVLVAHSIFFICCMSFSWPSPVLPKLMETADNPLGRQITYDESDLIGSIFYIGAGIGPLLFIIIVEKFGRRKVLVLLTSIAPITYGILVFAKNIELYYICRVVLGFFVGAAFSVQPVYVYQIVSPENREFYMSLITMFGIFGVLAAVSIGPFLPVHCFSGVIACFALIIFLLILFGFPETPHNVMQFKGKHEARKILEKLRYTDFEEELIEIEKTVLNETRESYFDIFKSVKNIKSFFLATIPLLMQSWSGIALIINYSQLIFLETKVEIPSHLCSIIVGLLTFSTSFFTPLLLKSKKFTPRQLLIVCLTGVGICDFVLFFYFYYGKNFPALSWLPLVSLICFVLVYNCGLDPLPWYFMGSAYPMSISAVGTALSSSIFQFSVFPLLFLFYKVGLSTLFLFSSCWCFLGIIYLKFVVNDTEHIEHQTEEKKIEA